MELPDDVLMAVLTRMAYDMHTLAVVVRGNFVAILFDMNTDRICNMYNRMMLSIKQVLYLDLSTV